MVFVFPLAIWLGTATIISLFITAGFGIAYHYFHKPVFRFHKFFAFLTITMAIIHAVFAFLLYFGVII